MALVKIRPMSDKDFNDVMTRKGIYVSDYQNSMSAPSAINPAIFGTKPVPDVRTRKVSADSFWKTGVIRLPVRVPNYFVCGKDLSLLRMILPNTVFGGEDGRVGVTSIMSCEYIYDLKEHKWINTNLNSRNLPVIDRERYIFGGDLLLYFIEQLNVEDEIEKLLLADAYSWILSASAEYGVRKKVKTFAKKNGCLEVTKRKTQFPIIDNYYLDIHYYDNEDKQDFDNPDFIKIVNECVAKYSEAINGLPCNRLGYLLQLRSSEYMENLKSCLQNKVCILPMGFRLGIGDSQSPITKMYNHLISAANNLNSAMLQRANTMDKIIQYYKKMITAYQAVLLDHSYADKEDQKGGYKGLVETIKGKTGIVRDVLHSVTIDNAGRTVIVGAPEIPIDSIGIPYTMLREMCDEHYVMYLRKREERRSKNGRLKNFVPMTPEQILDQLSLFKADSRLNETKKFINHLFDCIPEGEQKDKIMYSICRDIVPYPYIAFGRQPTLYKYGIQGAKVIPVEGSAIKLSPLCVVAFNADFDGDQMHINLPISIEAQKEVANNMFIIRNIYLSKNGGIHIAPRHEILYGLWFASKQKPTGQLIERHEVITKTLINKLCDWVENDVYDLTDIIEINGNQLSLGQAVVKACFGPKYADYLIGRIPLVRGGKIIDKDASKLGYSVSDMEDDIFTEEWSKEMLENIYDNYAQGSAQFVDTINRFTRVGIAVSMHYPMAINLNKTPDISKYLTEFDKDIEKVQRQYNWGLETYENYALKYSEAYAKLRSAVEKGLMTEGSDLYLGEDNGYLQLVNSKARGNKSNLMQMFGLKGQMQKNSVEDFMSIIRTSMGHGLTGFEHFVTAYGGRSGQISKSIETATPGYLYTILQHASCNITITEDDCGTDGGILLDWSFLRLMIGEPMMSNAIVYDEVYSLFKKVVKRRRIVEIEQELDDDDTIRFVFESFIAERHGNDVEIKQGCKLRSPVTCENPCCKACYGQDLSKHAIPRDKLAIGFEAAQSIGEPAAQLILKVFQKGGVSGEGGLTSAFKLIEDYFHLRSLDGKTSSQNKVRSCDVVSPYTGSVRQVISNQFRTKQVYICDEKGEPFNRSRPYVFPSNTRIRPSVSRGETLMQTTGNLELDEVKEVLGLDYEIKYLVFKLWQIFSGEGVNIKHFEVVVSSMIMYKSLQNVGDFKAGQIYTRKEYCKMAGYMYNNFLIKTLVSVKEVPFLTGDSLRGFMFEDQSRAIRTHVLRNDTDNLDDMYVRLALGLPLDL